RHRVGVTGEHGALVVTEIGAGDEVVADAIDREPRHGAELRFEPVRDLLLVMALRPDVDELGRERDEIRQVAPPWSRSTSFNFDFSWRSPGSRRLMTSTHGIPNSP